MDIKRSAYRNLVEWKDSPSRKPLLIRGARQVGKTTLVRKFADEFDNYIELNLEKENENNLFVSDNITTILNAAFLLKKISPKKGSLLLFIDEIQESPKAIQMLRYFYEDTPEIYVVAAGSLLEFAMQKVPNFPVGRVEYLYLHPLNFEEYLGAQNNEQALQALKLIPVPEYAHTILLDLFHAFTTIGGMPEIVANYIGNQNIAGLSKTYRQTWQAYKDDIEKYAQNNTYRNIMRFVMETAPSETDRIKFEGFGKSNYRSREVGEAFRALDMARIVRLIYPTTSLKPPLEADHRKRPRIQFLDTGMINNVLSFQGEMLLLSDFSNYYKGKVIQQMVYQELMSIHLETEYKPNFWVREEKDSNSEVDLVYQFEKYIIPIEIKSGKTGTLRSLHQFIGRCNHKYALRVYAGKLSVENATTPAGKSYLLLNLPYYLSFMIPQYISWFIESNPSD